MAKTPNLQITLLEVGQNDKELTINEAISTIDTAIGNFSSTGYLGEFSSAPNPVGLEAGSSYYDLTFQVFKTLNTSGTWVTSSGGGVSAGVDSVNGRSGVVVLESADITTALGFTPYNSTNPSNYISSITSGNVTTALGYTPYNATNPSGYISGITSGDVTTALGYTPYDAANPAGYTTNTGTVTSVSVTGNNGITQSVATGTTTPSITLGLGDITPTSVTTDRVDLNTGATVADAVGRLKWNDTDGTMDIGLKGGNVILQVGQEQVQRVTNNSGVDIPEGAVVYVTGASGNRVTVALASNTDELHSHSTIGVATESILNNQSGFITTEGLVRNINTLGYTEGGSVFLGTNGAFTQTHPVAPLHSVVVGYVVRAHATLGMIYVKVTGGFELDEIHDILLTAPANNDVLTYESSTGLWKNKVVPTTTPGGSTGNIQYNVSGGFTGTNNFTWSDASKILYLGGEALVKAGGSLSLAGATNANTILSAVGTGSVIIGTAGTDRLKVESNGDLTIYSSTIKLPGTNDATWPYFQSSVANGKTSIRAYGNGTGGSEFTAINGSDITNNHGQVLWTSSTGYGIYAFKNGTGTAQPWYLTQGAAGNASLTMQTNGDLNVSYNLTLDGAGKALQGDFSNADATLRNRIQTSTTDGATRLSIVPNGTGTTANIQVENSSSLVDSSVLTVGANSSELFLNSGVRGTGTQLPLNVYASGGKRAISIPSTGHIVLPKDSGYGIKVDTTAPEFGWKDLLGPIMLRGGAQNPTSNVFRNTIYGYQFALNDEVQLVYHMPHDWVPGTDLFLHTHWAHNNAGVTSGGITFTADCTFAKGFDQEAFPATKSISWTQAASTVQYRHMVAETQITIAGGSATQIDTSTLEVDGLLLVRLAVTNNTINGAPQPFIFTADIHYQSSGIATKNKAPNFYA